VSIGRDQGFAPIPQSRGNSIDQNVRIVILPMPEKPNAAPNNVVILARKIFSKIIPITCCRYTG
jgi:hypothetical protein